MSNVILIGFMGCGKSSVGRRLSYRVRKTWIDTDKLIEHQQKRSIKDIFAMEGENYFRDLETQCLRILKKDRERHVISVGGGLPMREQNQALLQKLGLVVYLRVKPETIMERLKHDKKRPLLQGDNPKEKIQKLMQERGPVYEKVADVIIDTDGKELRQIVKEVQEAYCENISH